MQICRLTAKEGVTVKEIDELIRVDAILVARILRMVNSAFYGLRNPAETVAEAIVYLGMKSIRNIVVWRVGGSHGHSSAACNGA